MFESIPSSGRRRVLLAVVLGMALIAAGPTYASTAAPAGTLSIAAPTSTFGTDGFPAPIAVDTAGDLFIADNYEVEKITPSGTSSVVAGTGVGGRPHPGPATSSKIEPSQLALDSAGNLYIDDSGYAVILKVDTSGTLSIVAGNGQLGQPTPGPATSSSIGFIGGMAVDSAGNLFLDDDNLIEKVTPGGTLSLVSHLAFAFSGQTQPGPAASGQLYNPAALVVDGAGDLYIADRGHNVVKKVNPSGVTTIVAGSGSGATGRPTPGDPTASSLDDPTGLALDTSGNLYIADSGNNLVERITPTGVLSVIAGTGQAGAPTSGPATASDLSNPTGLGLDPAGNLYIADNGNNVVEELAGAATSLANITPPSISGAPQIGRTLNASAGTWTLAGDTYSYQWFAAGTPIAGATHSTFAPGVAQLGKALFVKVTASQDGYAPTTATSSPTQPVAKGVIAIKTLPTITGTKRVGYTLTAYPGAWSPGSLTYHYQWYRGTTAIRGAVYRALKLSSSMRGYRIRVRVTASRLAYTSLAKFSYYTAVVR